MSNLLKYKYIYIYCTVTFANFICVLSEDYYRIKSKVFPFSLQWDLHPAAFLTYHTCGDDLLDGVKGKKCLFVFSKMSWSTS